MKSLKTRIIAGFIAVVLVTGILSGCAAKNRSEKIQEHGTQTVSVDATEKRLIDFIANSEGEVPAILKDKLVEKIYQANADVKSFVMDLNMKIKVGSREMPMDMRFSGTVKPTAMQLEGNIDIGIGKQNIIVRMFAPGIEDLKNSEIYLSVDGGKTWKKEDSATTKARLTSTKPNQMIFTQKELLQSAKFEVKAGKIYANFDGKKFLELNNKGLIGKQVQGDLKAQVSSVYNPKTFLTETTNTVVEGNSPQGKYKVETKVRLSGVNSTKAPEKPKVS